MTREIKPVDTVKATLALPGSKSYSHRALIAAALADGESLLTNVLDAEDTRLTARALEMLGAGIDWRPEVCRVRGTGGRLAVPTEVLDLGNSGTSMRLLTAVAALGQGTYRLSGSERMCQRPIQDLLDALVLLGVDAAAERSNGCPPVVLHSRGLPGGPTRVSGRTSSQFVSALLLIAPFGIRGVDIEVMGELVSRPYVDITLDVMGDFHVAYYREDYQFFSVPAGQRYRSRDYAVEGDASSASYFLGAAALTGGRVTLTNLNRRSYQGDIHFVEILTEMGCRSQQTQSGLVLTGGPLRAVRVNMATMPDLVPTLAVVAAYAQGETVISGVAHLRHKESDRLRAVATELNRMGIAASETADGLAIPGGTPHGAIIATYNDHRIAMSFALAGLRTPGVSISDPGCVSKSFPEFWEYFARLSG